MNNTPDFGRQVYYSLENIVVQSLCDVDYGISRVRGKVDGSKYAISEFPTDVSVWDRHVIQVIGNGPEKFLKFVIDKDGNVLEGKLPNDMLSRLDKFTYDI